MRSLEETQKLAVENDHEFPFKSFMILDSNSSTLFSSFSLKLYNKLILVDSLRTVVS